MKQKFKVEIEVEVEYEDESIYTYIGACVDDNHLAILKTTGGDITNVIVKKFERESE